ncbi:MAG: hypothetical protein RLZZ126_621 [Pseudomonadota bacterium]|jgi:DNA-binding FadR family transcriptional regulator
MVKNVHGNTVDLLGEAIVAGRYPQGCTLPPEPLLCVELGVSRTVVREAIKSLVAKGLISTGPKVGTKVLPSDQWNWIDAQVISWQVKAGLTPEFVRDLQDLRRVVEPAAVRMAAKHASADDIEELRAAFAGMEDAAHNGGDYVAHDLRFHQGLLLASHNRMLIQMGKALSALLRASFEVSTQRTGGPVSSLPTHKAVMLAVAAGQPVKAEKAILALIDGAQQDIESILNSRRKLPRPAAYVVSRKTA